MSSSVLFDAPGPRARRRIAWLTALSILVFLALVGWAVWLFGSQGQLAADKWVAFTQWPYIQFLLEGLGNTMLCTVVAGVVAFPLGLFLALGRLSRRRWIAKGAGAWVEVFRTIPLLLLIYVFIGALPPLGINPPIFWKLVIPIILCSSAVIAEVFRAGILALPRGQTEAASALGLTRAQTMRRVILPQAIRLMVPSLVTQVVSLLKDSTLGYAASYPELMKQAQNLTAYTGDLIQTYLVVAVVYIVLNAALSQFAAWLERRQGRRTSRRRAQHLLAGELTPSAT